MSALSRSLILRPPRHPGGSQATRTRLTVRVRLPISTDAVTMSLVVGLARPVPCPIHQQPTTPNQSQSRETPADARSNRTAPGPTVPSHLSPELMSPGFVSSPPSRLCVSSLRPSPATPRHRVISNRRPLRLSTCGGGGGAAAVVAAAGAVAVFTHPGAADGEKL